MHLVRALAFIPVFFGPYCLFFMFCEALGTAVGLSALLWCTSVVGLVWGFLIFDYRKSGFRCGEEDGSVVTGKNLTSARSRLRRHVAQWSRSSRCVHTPWCLLVSANVPPWRLCGSLSVDEPSGACRPRAPVRLLWCPPASGVRLPWVRACLGCLPVRLCAVCSARVWGVCAARVCGVCDVCAPVSGARRPRAGQGRLPASSAPCARPPASSAGRLRVSGACLPACARGVCVCVVCTRGVCACPGCPRSSCTRRPSVGRRGTFPPGTARVTPSMELVGRIPASDLLHFVTDRN